MQFEFVSLLVIALFSISAQAYRYDWSNITCKGLHGLHCGTYYLKVKDQNDTYIGQSYFVGADVLASEPSDAWARYLKEEYKFLPRLTTVQTINATNNFVPLVGTTNQETCNFQSIENAMIPFVNTVTSELSFDAWNDNSWNSTRVTGLASQLLNASYYGVQVATCTPGFVSDLLDAPTVNIFNAEDTLPVWCTPIEIEPVCPVDVNL
ncbi:LAFE_0C13916g1_1 [Lachancea fermentati]|uniref:LAFE_0C13916g1_1 n=1 Tax=Lachancea fermentati TaxID=4955 RepID=A0A1G4MAS7_LACFM|nr:LAFE_0C13916g1_1 [Lachancea fermentati]